MSCLCVYIRWLSIALSLLRAYEDVIFTIASGTSPKHPLSFVRVRLSEPFVVGVCLPYRCGQETATSFPYLLPIDIDSLKPGLRDDLRNH